MRNKCVPFLKQNILNTLKDKQIIIRRPCERQYQLSSHKFDSAKICASIFSLPDELTYYEGHEPLPLSIRKLPGGQKPDYQAV